MCFFGLPAAGLSSAGFQLSVAMEQGFSAQMGFKSMFAQIICGFSAQMGFKNVFAQIISGFCAPDTCHMGRCISRH